MAAPNTQSTNPIVENEVAPPEATEPEWNASRSTSSLFDAALKDAFITVGTVWFIATLVAIGAYALELQLIAVVAAFVVVAMMFAWLAGLSFLVAGWVARRFDVIAALTGGKTSIGAPGQGRRN